MNKIKTAILQIGGGGVSVRHQENPHQNINTASHEHGRNCGQDIGSQEHRCKRSWIYRYDNNSAEWVRADRDHTTDFKRISCRAYNLADNIIHKCESLLQKHNRIIGIADRFSHGPLSVGSITLGRGCIAC